MTDVLAHILDPNTNLRQGYDHWVSGLGRVAARPGENTSSRWVPPEQNLVRRDGRAPPRRSRDLPPVSSQVTDLPEVAGTRPSLASPLRPDAGRRSRGISGHSSTLEATR